MVLKHTWECTKSSLEGFADYCGRMRGIEAFIEDSLQGPCLAGF